MGVGVGVGVGEGVGGYRCRCKYEHIHHHASVRDLMTHKPGFGPGLASYLATHQDA